MKLTQQTVITVGVPLLGALLAAGSAAAQDDMSGVPAADPGWNFSLDIGFGNQFDADFDDGGDYDVQRFGADVNARRKLSEDARLSIRFAFDLDAYDFSSASVFGATDPWDDIYTYTLGVIWEWDLNNDWSVFAGPVVRVSGESGADWGDAITGGGVIGASYKAGNNLTIGFGLSIMSEIEDDFIVIPMPILDWRINDSLHLRTASSAATWLPSGLEFVWSGSGKWEFGLGGGYHYRRFRLDDNGPVPDGVGEESGFPIWFRASRDFGANVSVNLLAGAMFSSEIEVNDDDGDTLADDDADPAAFVGISARIRF